MQPYTNEAAPYYQRDHKKLHDKCKKHLYQFIQVEMNDGAIYQGLLHSYDKNNIYIIMPNTNQPNTSNAPSMHTEDESRLYPFFGPFGLFGFPFYGIRGFGPFFPFFV